MLGPSPAPWACLVLLGQVMHTVQFKTSPHVEDWEMKAKHVGNITKPNKPPERGATSTSVGGLPVVDVLGKVCGGQGQCNIRGLM